MYPGIRRVVLVAGAATALAVGVGSAPALAAPAADIPNCAAQAAGTREASEWGSCLHIDAVLDHAPAVGETANLRFSVRADAALPPTEIAVELPHQIAWVATPAGFRVTGATATEPERAGALAVARLTRQLKAGETAEFTGAVRGAWAGPTQVRLTATAGTESSRRLDLRSAQTNGAYAQADTVFVTVGDRGQRSILGYPESSAQTTAAPDVPRAARPSWLAPRSVGTAGLPKPAGRASTNAACDTIVVGNWSYVDQAGVWHNAMNFQVQVWDADSFSGPDLLAVGITDSAGNYSLCFDSNADAAPETGTADVFVQFVSSNAIWQVRRGGGPFSFQSSTTPNVIPGSVLNLGSLTAADNLLQRGLHAYDEANDAWLFIPKPTNACFDQADATCRQLLIDWAPDSTDGTFYSLEGNDVHLAANDPNSPTAVVHEIGHAIMDDVYNDAYPPHPTCSPHFLSTSTSTGCAWTEGFADWFAITVYNTATFTFTNGTTTNLENQTWGNLWADGDATEGRVAGALLDLADSNNELYWDRYGEGFTKIWSTVTRHVCNTFAEFWANRSVDGFDVTYAGGMAALYQNTIDYGFRDPMGDYTPMRRPAPVPPHTFIYQTNKAYWSVVALRPSPGSNADLKLYDDRPLTAFLAGSAESGSIVDFVAVDSNRRPFGDYYPQANRVLGADGQYQIELAQGAQILYAGGTSFSMGLADVVEVRDTYLPAGVPVTISLTPTAGQEAELFLLGDDPANPYSFIRTRSSAVASSTSPGPGTFQQVTYTPPVTGWYGVVVINKNGSGTYSLSRS